MSILTQLLGVDAQIEKAINHLNDKMHAVLKSFRSRITNNSELLEGQRSRVRDLETEDCNKSNEIAELRTRIEKLETSKSRDEGMITRLLGRIYKVESLVPNRNLEAENKQLREDVQGYVSALAVAQADIVSCHLDPKNELGLESVDAGVVLDFLIKTIKNLKEGKE